MTEEKNKKEPEVTTPDSAATETPKTKKGLNKYILFGGGGLLLLVIIAVVLILLLKKSDDAASSATDSPQSEHPTLPNHLPSHDSLSAQAAPAIYEDSLLGDLNEFGFDENDSNLMDKIMGNLEFLDYSPTEGAGDSDGAEVESVHFVKGDSAVRAELDLRQSELDKREKELDARKSELERLDRKINQQILKIEQAQSSRVMELAKLYDNMDSRAVAQLMANLDDETVVSLLPRMKSKNASSVLQLMPAQRAARLSKQMITIADK